VVGRSARPSVPAPRRDHGLPPEPVRTDPFDEIVVVDLPGPEARADVLRGWASTRTVLAD
jgi:hypothetical protein